MTIDEVKQIIAGRFPPQLQQEIEQQGISFEAELVQSTIVTLPDQCCMVTATSKTGMTHGDLIQTSHSADRVSGALCNLVRCFRFDDNRVM